MYRRHFVGRYLLSLIYLAQIGIAKLYTWLSLTVNILKLLWDFVIQYHMSILCYQNGHYFISLTIFSTPLPSDVFCAVILRSPLWLDPLLRTCWRSCWWKTPTRGWALDREGLKTSKHTPSSRSYSPQLRVTSFISLPLSPLLIHP